MNWYYFWGVVSSALFLSAIPAIMHQLMRIWQRKKLRARGELDEPATFSISVNQVFSSYIAVYSFFLFGLALDSPDPFLTYPRAVVGGLLYVVLYEIFCDRVQSRASRAAFYTATASLAVPIVFVSTGARSSDVVRAGSHVLVCVATMVMAQGGYSQFRLLSKNQARGAVSLPMHVVLYLKDLSGLIFGLQIGIAAWSIVLMHLVNLIMRAPIIYVYSKLPR